MNNDNQKWRIEWVQDNYYRIISDLSDKALEVAGASHDNGANVYQMYHPSANNQLWQFMKVEGLKSATMMKDQYSQIAEVEKEVQMMVYPNPMIDGRGTLLYVSDESCSAMINVYSPAGQLIHRQRNSVEIGDNKKPVLLDRAGPGLYLVEILTNKQRCTARLVVK